MRIKCPYCGEREASEFTYLGAADLKRPDPAAPDAEALFFEYAYIRDNPAGPMAFVALPDSSIDPASSMR